MASSRGGVDESARFRRNVLAWCRAMKYTVTHKVDSHQVNLDYECLLVDVLNDPTFHYRVFGNRLVKADLMPTDDFVLDLALQLARVSPTFFPKLDRLVTEICMER